MRHTRTRVVVAAIALLLAAGPAGADVQPGDKITAANAEKVKDLVSPGLYWAIQYGLPMEIIEAKETKMMICCH